MNQNIFSLPQCLWSPNLAGWLHTTKSKTFWWSSLARSRDKLNTWYLYCRKTYGHSTWKGDELLYGLPRIKSENSQNTWSHEIKWQIKHVISLLPLDLWPLNVARWWLTIKRLPPTKSHNPLKHDLLRSRDKLKTCYLHYHNAWSHQSQQPGALGWVDSNNEVTWPFE